MVGDIGGDPVVVGGEDTVASSSDFLKDVGVPERAVGVEAAADKDQDTAREVGSTRDFPEDHPLLGVGTFS